LLRCRCSGPKCEELLTNGIEQLQKANTPPRDQFRETLALSPADARALPSGGTRASLGECGNSLSELRHQFERNPTPNFAS